MFRFDNTYARLPERFYARVSPTRVRGRADREGQPRPRRRARRRWRRARALRGAEVLAGNAIPEGAEPIALAYAGHQFGAFVPQLGDGRAILLGEVVGKDGARRDVQLKGAGRTPFSRGGDGRAALGPVLREYVVSEAMAALGIPTTRALAAVTTGEVIARDSLAARRRAHARRGEPHPRRYVRVLRRTGRPRRGLAALASYALARHYPDAAGSGNDALALLERVIAAQASLVARWLGVGFIHGVMNTDNTSISGETIDYGPCAFLDEYDPDKRFSSIDTGGRYAFANQPRIAQWNLTRLAEALLPLLADDEDEAVAPREGAPRALPRDLRGGASGGAPREARARRAGPDDDEEDDAPSPRDLLERLASNQVDYTLFFRRLCASAEDPRADAETARSSRTRARSSTGPSAGAGGSRARTSSRARAPRPCGARTPRSFRETIGSRRSSARRSTTATSRRSRRSSTSSRGPYDDRADRPDLARFADPPRPEERVLETFCGT